jgi:A/G-specific adenine glycosylase
MESFSKTVWQYYRLHGRHDLPWRQLGADGRIDPYKVLVSELMLQQTQVQRVIPKFEGFVQQFPTFEVLANAPLAEVLKAWNGLGYNRRAKFLWHAASQVVHDYSGVLPQTTSELTTLSGVGPNTAGAILAYAHNKPSIFIETNIRTVFIHHFFAGQTQVSDKHIVDMVARTLPDNPREWYWALMDYGTHLKQTIGNLNKLSKHYVKQSAFHGSKRQIRGAVLRLLVHQPYTITEIADLIADERLDDVMNDLVKEGLLKVHGGRYKLGGS